MRNKTLILNGNELDSKGSGTTEQMPILTEEKRRYNKSLFAHHCPLSWSCLLPSVDTQISRIPLIIPILQPIFDVKDTFRNPIYLSKKRKERVRMPLLQKRRASPVIVPTISLQWYFQPFLSSDRSDHFSPVIVPTISLQW